MKSIDPSTNQLIQEYKPMSSTKAAAIVNASHLAFQAWRFVDFEKRASLMNKAAAILCKNKNTYAKLMTAEMGKLHQEGVAEIEKCAWVCEYYAENAKKFLQDETVKTENQHSFITYQPIGGILAVMPWNYPFWQVFRFAAPTLMAGNVGLLKHASNVCGTALAIESIFQEAGFPENIFRTLLIPSSQVASIIEHQHVRAITLTGSTEAGKSVAANAGACLKKTVLELGGSDPYIILKDADITQAAKLCAQSRLLNAGQSCIGAKRFIVVEEVFDAFVEKFVKNMQEGIGNIAPLASIAMRDALHDQVEESVEKGAGCILGGQKPDSRGAYYPPTVLTDVRPGMPAYDEELFGPVASIIQVKNEQEAIKVANSTSFGLGGAVFTKNIEQGTHIARNLIDSGACAVNDFVKSDPRLPFGGIKESGYGRELSYFGIREFVNIKSVMVR